jgi:MarR family transcriptional regulator, lower aerobic nicotinate degradation pathway regulator
VTPEPSARDVGEAILTAAARLTSLLSTACADEGVSPTQARLMRALVEDVPQGRLAELLALDPARVSALSGDLERRGLVERVPSRSDRRRRHARLTPEGAEVVRRIGARLATESPLSRLDGAEREQLVRLLDRALGHRC